MHLPLLYVDLCLIVFSDKFNCTVPGTFQPDNDTNVSSAHSPSTEINIPTVASEISKNITIFTTTTLLPDRAYGGNGIAVYIVVGGVLFLLIVIIVMGIIVGLSVRRVKHIHSVATRPADMNLKSSKQIPSDSSNFDSPSILETIPSEGVFKFKEELDKDRSCLTRLSVLSTLKPSMPTHPDMTVQESTSAEQLYICPIMSNMCEPEDVNL